MKEIETSNAKLDISPCICFKSSPEIVGGNKPYSLRRVVCKSCGRSASYGYANTDEGAIESWNKVVELNRLKDGE